MLPCTNWAIQKAFVSRLHSPRARAQIISPLSLPLHMVFLPSFPCMRIARLCVAHHPAPSAPGELSTGAASRECHAHPPLRLSCGGSLWSSGVEAPLMETSCNQPPMILDTPPSSPSRMSVIARVASPSSSPIFHGLLKLLSGHPSMRGHEDVKDRAFTACDRTKERPDGHRASQDAGAYGARPWSTVSPIGLARRPAR
jgi:hypothetical protein